SRGVGAGVLAIRSVTFPGYSSSEHVTPALLNFCPQLLSDSKVFLVFRSYVGAQRGHSQPLHVVIEDVKIATPISDLYPAQQRLHLSCIGFLPGADVTINKDIQCMGIPPIVKRVVTLVVLAKRSVVRQESVICSLLQGIGRGLPRIDEIVRFSFFSIPQRSGFIIAARKDGEGHYKRDSPLYRLLHVFHHL